MSRMVKNAIFLVLGLSVAWPALAQERAGTALPEAGNVSLPLEEYNRLAELANKPRKRPELPPLPFVLKRAELKLHAGQDSVVGTIQLEGEVFKKGLVEIPLLSGMTLREAKLEGQVLPVRQQNGRQSAIVSGPAEFSLVMEASCPLYIKAGLAAFALPPLATGSTTLTLEIPGDHANVDLNPGLITKRTSENGHTTVTATLPPGQAVKLSWLTREMPVSVAAREVRFLADLKTLLSVSEGQLKLAVLAEIGVVQGEPTQFDLVVPAGYEVTNVNGAALESYEVNDGTLVLKLAGSAQRNYQFLIAMERNLSESKVEAPFLIFPKAQREDGEVLVEGSGTMELTATEGGSLKRLDVREVSPYLRSLAHFSPQAAFRYHKQPKEAPTLTLEWNRFPDAGVLAAVAENALVTTMVTSEGQSLSEIRLTVRNQAQPFLKVALPVGASIVSADVAGEKVKPVEGADGNRVPLLRAGFRPTNAYDVSFVIMHSGTPFAKKGAAELSLPKLDIPISLLRWEVFLPERYKVKDFGGDAMSIQVAPALWEGGEYEPDHHYGISGLAPAGQSYMASVWSLSYGELGGTVSDPSGAVISGAEVTLSSPGSRARRTVTTDSSGAWRTADIASGNVTIEVSKAGFQRVIETLNYQAGKPAPVDVTLPVGGTAETVMVEAQTRQVETQTSSVNALISNRKMENLPLNGRNFTSLMQLAPGVTTAGQDTAASQYTPPSANVLNLQKRVAGVLPVAIEVPRAGASFRFVRPLVVDEETKLTFHYGTK